ncbi:uncharacterized protein LOC144468435 [Augochlora pura]
MLALLLRKVPSKASLTLQKGNKPSLQFRKSSSQRNVPAQFLQQNFDFQESKLLSQEPGRIQIPSDCLDVVCRNTRADRSSKRLSKCIFDRSASDHRIFLHRYYATCRAEEKPPLTSEEGNFSDTEHSLKAHCLKYFRDATAGNKQELKIIDYPNYWRSLDTDYFQSIRSKSPLCPGGILRYYSRAAAPKRYENKSLKRAEEQQCQPEDCSDKKDCSRGEKLSDCYERAGCSPPQRVWAHHEYSTASETWDQQGQSQQCRQQEAQRECQQQGEHQQHNHQQRQCQHQMKDERCQQMKPQEHLSYQRHQQQQQGRRQRQMLRQPQRRRQYQQRQFEQQQEEQQQQCQQRQEQQQCQQRQQQQQFSQPEQRPCHQEQQCQQQQQQQPCQQYSQQGQQQIQYQHRPYQEQQQDYHRHEPRQEEQQLQYQYRPYQEQLQSHHEHQSQQQQQQCQYQNQPYQEQQQQQQQIPHDQQCQGQSQTNVQSCSYQQPTCTTCNVTKTPPASTPQLPSKQQGASTSCNNQSQSSFRNKITQMCSSRCNKHVCKPTNEEASASTKRLSSIKEGLSSLIWKRKSPETIKEYNRVPTCRCERPSSEPNCKTCDPLPPKPFHWSQKRRRSQGLPCGPEIFIPYKSSVRPKSKHRTSPRKVHVDDLIQEPIGYQPLKNASNRRGFNKAWQESCTSNPRIVRFEDKKGYQTIRKIKTGEELRSETSFATLGSSSCQKPAGTFIIDDVSNARPNTSALKYRLTKCPTVDQMWQQCRCELPEVPVKSVTIPKPIPVKRRRVQPVQGTGEWKEQRYPVRLKIFKSKDTLDPCLPTMIEVSKDRSSILETPEVKLMDGGPTCSSATKSDPSLLRKCGDCRRKSKKVCQTYSNAPRSVK